MVRVSQKKGNFETWDNSSYMHSVLQKKCTLKMIILSFAALFSSQKFYIILILKKTLELVNG